MSGVAPVTWEGQDLYIPGYYAKRNTSNLNVGGATASRLVLIGESKSGIPFNATTDYPNPEDRINWVSNTSELNSILRDGPAYYGALFALSPSNQEGINGPSQVGVIRINKALQSSRTVVDIDSDDVLVIKSKNYGLFTNQTRVKISAGTNEGKKISAILEDTTVEVDDLISEIITIQYVGTGTACAFTLDPVGNLTTTVTAGPGSEDLSIDLTAYDTVGNLVAYIDNLSVYSATLIGDGNLAVSELDKIVAGDSVNIKTAYNVQATLKAIIDWINNSSLILTAALAGSAERRLPDNDTDYVFLTGGSEGATPVQDDYQDALDEICAAVDISLLGALTSNAAIHAAIGTHCTYMSGIIGRNERQACFGGASGDSESTIKSASQALNNALVGYFGSEIKRYDKSGVLTTWAGFYGACEILGMSAGNRITLAPTNKMLNCVGTKDKYTLSQKNAYIKAGAMVAEASNQGGFRTVRSVTTYQGANKVLNEWSAVRTILFITKDHRTYVESLIGEAGDATGIESVKNRALSRLDHYEEEGYFVVDPELGNSYRNFQYVVEGDVFKMTYEATIVLPINFILVTHNFTVIGANRI
jgi:hypothetical protein